jgi:putative SOS response-associated peptidase YedK
VNNRLGAAKFPRQPVHDRMPGILAPENHGRWLDVGKHDPADLLRYASNQMQAYPISVRIHSRNVEDAEREPLNIAWGAGCFEP